MAFTCINTNYVTTVIAVYKLGTALNSYYNSCSKGSLFCHKIHFLSKFSIQFINININNMLAIIIVYIIEYYWVVISRAVQSVPQVYCSPFSKRLIAS